MGELKKGLLKGAKDIGLGLLLMGIGGFAMHKGDKMSRTACKNIADDVAQKYKNRKGACSETSWPNIQYSNDE